jgi:uncharacterized protein
VTNYTAPIADLGEKSRRPSAAPPFADRRFFDSIKPEPRSLKESPMLELRPGCECCDRDLPPASADARICSYECTFCAACAEGVLNGVCPNCGGNLVPRPIRPAALLARHPASTKRIVKKDGCPSQAA